MHLEDSLAKGHNLVHVSEALQRMPMSAQYMALSGNMLCFNFLHKISSGESGARRQEASPATVTCTQSKTKGTVV